VDSKQGLGGRVLTARARSAFLDAVAALEVEKVVTQAAKHLGVAYATAPVLGEEIEDGRERAEVVVRLNMKFEPVFVHASSIAQPG